MAMVLRTIYDDLLDDLVCDFSDYFDDEFYDECCDICAPTGYTFIPTATVLLPALDVTELEKEYTINMEVPGYGREDINVEMEGNTLTISSDLEDREFCQSIDIAEDAKLDEINATLDKGILTLRIPKKEAPPAKKIEIKAVEEPKELEVKEAAPQVKEATPEVKEEKKE